MFTFRRFKYRQILLVCLVLTALGTIVLPMQVEQPLFFFKSKQVDDQMFAQPLVNLRQAFNEEDIRLAKQEAVAAKRIQLAHEKPNVNAELPKAWVIKVAEMTSKEAAVQQVNELQSQGFPAFYRQELAAYYVMIGPEVDLAAVKEWQTKIGSTQPDAVIKTYQPV